jgi:hypothetical protein
MLDNLIIKNRHLAMLVEKILHETPHDKPQWIQKILL